MATCPACHIPIPSGRLRCPSCRTRAVDVNSIYKWESNWPSSRYQEGPADILPRGMAVLLDGVFLSGLTWLAAGLMGPFGQTSGGGLMAEHLLLAFLPFLYGALSEGSAWQATPGKRLMGLKVATTEGEPLTMITAMWRQFIKLLTVPVYLISVVTILITVDHQAIHDMAAGTTVMG